MRKIFTLVPIFILACSPTINEHDNNIRPSKENSSEKPFWSDSTKWGKAERNVNLINDSVALDDNRINNLYKQVFPDFLKEYVLWRVRHDGNCWVTSLLVQILYHMTTGTRQQYNIVLNNIKKLGDEYKNKDPNFAKNSLEIDFYDLLELIGLNMDFEYALNLINHEKTYRTLNLGIRKFLAAYTPEKKVSEFGEWGVLADYQNLIYDLGLNFNLFYLDDILSRGKNIELIKLYINNNAPLNFFASIEEYRNNILGPSNPQREVSIQKYLERLNETKKFLANKLIRPKIFSFRSEIYYMDVLVEKDFANNFK